MNDIRVQAVKLKSYVFRNTLGYSNTFLTAIQNQTPAFETKYARDDLKASIGEVVKEMESRITQLSANGTRRRAHNESEWISSPI